MDFKLVETPLVHAKKLGDSLGLPHLYLKVESKNPTRTHKDRAALALVQDAREKGHVGLTIGTCGNFGASVAKLCQKYGMRCTIFIPKRYHGERSREMEHDGATVIGTDMGYEEAVEQSNMYARLTKYYDANPNAPDATTAALNAYAKIASEIGFHLSSESLESVWVPVGNGTTLAGIHQGFARLGRPVLFGAVSSKGNNAVISSFFQQESVELDPSVIVETHINEPLLNYRSYHVNEAMEALGDKGRVYGATDEEMLIAARELRTKEDVIAHPASASVLSGLSAHVESLHKDKCHVLILTS